MGYNTLQQLIDYYWEDEKKDYEEYIYSLYNKEALFPNNNRKDIIKFILSNSLVTNHIFVILCHLQNEIYEDIQIN